MESGLSPNSKRDATSDSISSRSVRPRLFLKPSETLFRLLCPSSIPTSLLSDISLPGFRIHIHQPIPSDESIILIDYSNDGDFRDHDTTNYVYRDSDEGSLALLRVFESMVRMRDDDNNNKNADSDSDSMDGLVVCRLLVPSNQVGRVLGRGGKVVEKIRQDSLAQVKIFPKDQIPPCASPGDELIQITGNFPAVKKALLSVSFCLQDSSRVDSSNSFATKPLGAVSMPIQDDFSPKRRYASRPHNPDYRSRGYSSIPGHENVGAGHRAPIEEDVVFRLLCLPDKVGSLIGKGGTVVRALQNETGASIKIVDMPDLDERVVVISARESLEQTYSPAQEAVIRVHCRIAEVGHEPGSAVVARLLVHAQQVGYLVGRGGHIIGEMRRGTGTSINIFPREQVPNNGSENNEIVQVMGNLQSVQDALFHITNRLRDTVFPMRPHVPNFNTPSYLSPRPEMPSPLFRQVHNAHSPGRYPSQSGVPRGIDRFPIHGHPLDHQPAYSHSMSFNSNNMDGVPYPHGIERPGPFDGPSPRSWTPQKVVGSEIPKAATDVGFGMASMTEPYNSAGPTHFSTDASVEMVIPQSLFCHIYGDNEDNIAHVQKISASKVVVHDVKPGMFDVKVIVSGTPDQIRAAQMLIHAFILCGKTQS